MLTFHFPELKGKAEVYFDERLVPHVFAENDEDLYFIVGYLHAKFRLFQMDLSTRAAEGRASEVAGPSPFILTGNNAGWECVLPPKIH